MAEDQAKINFRFDREDLEMIRKAAELEDLSLNKFVIRAAKSEARKILRKNG